MKTTLEIVENRKTLSFEAIGTHWSIVTWQTIEADLVTVISDRIEVFDYTYSRFRSDSLVHELAMNAGSYSFPDDAAILFEFYRKLYDVSGGKVTPLIGGMLEKAGYDADYSLQPKPQEPLPGWDDVLKINGTSAQISQPLTLDFGAAGKGYLVDIICKLLDDARFSGYVVDASGDIRYKGDAAIRIGLEDPRKEGDVIGVIEFQNQSLCASATNRRKWGNYHHIFDPNTKDSTTEIMATWVLADSTMLADGIATALFFCTPDDLRKQFEFQYLRMHADGSVDYSPAFKDSFFTT